MKEIDGTHRFLRIEVFSWHFDELVSRGNACHNPSGIGAEEEQCK